MNHLARMFTIALCILGLASSPLSAEDLTKKEIFEKCSPAVVLVYQMVPQGGGKYTVKFGTGSIITAKGLVITNQHVIGNAGQVQVLLREPGKIFSRYVTDHIKKFRKKSIPAKVLHTNAKVDLAILQLQSKRTDYPTIPLGKTSAVDIGEDVVAIGHPRGFVWTITRGIISSVRPDAIQTDAAINQGNSGGPLINNRGEMVGINTYIIRQSNNLGFARPIRLVWMMLSRHRLEKELKVEVTDQVFAHPRSTVKVFLRSALLEDIILFDTCLETKTKKKGNKILAQVKQLLSHNPRLAGFKTTGNKAQVTLVHYLEDKKIERIETPVHLVKEQGNWKIQQLGTAKPVLAKSTVTPPVQPVPGEKKASALGFIAKELLKEVLKKALKDKGEEFLKHFNPSEYTPKNDAILVINGPQSGLDRLDLDEGKYVTLGSQGWSAVGAWCVVDRFVYTTSTHSGKLYRIDPATGSDQVMADQGWKEVRHMVGLGNSIYAVNSKLGLLFTLDLATGKTTPLSKGFDEVAFLGGGKDKLFIISAKSGKIYQFDLATKTEKTLAGEGWMKLGPGCMRDGKIYITSTHSGKLYEIDPTSGKERVVSDGWSRVSDMTAGKKGLFIASSHSGKLYLVDPATGKDQEIAAGFKLATHLLAIPPKSVARHNMVRYLQPALRKFYEMGGVETKVHTTAHVDGKPVGAIVAFTCTGPNQKKVTGGFWISEEDGQMKIFEVFSEEKSMVLKASGGSKEKKGVTSWMKSAQEKLKKHLEKKHPGKKTEIVPTDQ